MAVHNRIDWNLEQLKQWIEVEGLTHAKVAERLGRPDKVVSKACKRLGVQSQRRGPRGAEGHPQWQGGRIVDKDGYVRIYAPHHPRSQSRSATKGRRSGNPYVLEHRLVMEMALGRYLLPLEVVHHRNADKKDNRIENLELFDCNGKHLAMELAGRRPEWSADGQARIQRAVERLGRSRKGLTRDAWRQRRSEGRSTAEPEPDDHSPS